jgi:hypothetical protein
MTDLAYTPNKLTSIVVDDETAISKKYFNENYAFDTVPVIFKKAFQDFTIKGKWSEEYLAGILIDEENIGGLKYDLPKYKTLQNYLTLNDINFQYKTNRHVFNKLSQDYATPSAFNCWYAAQFPENKLSWLSVLLKGAFTELQMGIWNTSGWDFLVKGKKEWFIYPAVYSQYITQHIDEFKSYTNPGKFNHLSNSDYKPMYCIQRSGEAVFIPGNCYYVTRSIETAISLEENFINETNYDNVRQYFRKTNNKLNLGMIDGLIRKNFETNNGFKNTHI